MSRYSVVQLNYITSGKNKTFLNLDISNSYEAYQSIRILEGISSEMDHRQRILSEQKTGYEQLCNFIARDSLGDITGVSADIYTVNGYMGGTQGMKISGLGLSSEDDLPFTGRMLGDDIRYSVSVDYDKAKISLEDGGSGILLDETQPYREYEDGVRSAFRLYTEKDLSSYAGKLTAFLENRKRMRNRTYVCETNTGGVTVNNVGKTIPLYDMVDMATKSSREQSKSTVVSFDSVKHRTEDIYLPQYETNPVMFCQSNGQTYVLNGGVPKDVDMLRSSLHDQRNTQTNTKWYKMQIEGGPTRTSFYGHPEDIVSDQNNPDFSLCAVQSGQRNSYVTRFDMTREYDFVNGHDYAEIIRTKSFYDGNYDMDASVQVVQGTPMLEHRNCRDYVGIGQSGGRVYLKYNTDTDYRSIGGQEGQSTEVSDGKVGYQKVESLLENSQEAVKYHKTNAFSVRIGNTKFGNESLYPELGDPKWQQFKKDMQNAIRQIVENVAPANTTLIDVQFGD